MSIFGEKKNTPFKMDGVFLKLIGGVFK